MLALRGVVLVAALLLGGCAAATGPHLDPHGRCQDTDPRGADSGSRSLWYLFCVQSP